MTSGGDVPPLTGRGARDGRLLHERFEGQARRRPDAVALVAGDAEITYGELDGRANRLARHLTTCGARPDQLVGICIDRGPGLVVAVLAVLKSGAAYVPLDPRYPAKRLSFMLSDAAAQILVASPGSLDALAVADVPRVIALDDAGHVDEPYPPPSEGVPGACAANLAYTIYTSGSTGRPKGVAITHASACSFLDWALGAYDAGELSAVLAATSLSFDLSVFELFAPLSCGGRVILARDVLALPELSAAGEVTLVNTVPSALEQLLAISPALPAAVRTVNLAGEPLPGALARRLYAMGHVTRVVNLYGPTEDTTYSTVAELDPAVELPPIGHPIAGGRAYVLDERLDTAPAGSVGDLYLAGSGLARGYLGRPDLTAERFLPDLHGPPGSRMYKTGDLARVLPDGSLDFRGRGDDQVKVRGFRIELGEIETVLRAHPGVRECAVAVRADPTGERRIVAWVVPADPADDNGDLRRFAGERLPDHMVPQAFVAIDAMPLSPNGKLDRASLPAVAPRTAAGPRPRGSTEETVAAVWSEVLGVEVGREDGFLELGGHSLLATQVVARLRGACQVELPLCDFIAQPTVAGVARTIDRLRGGAGATPAPAIARRTAVDAPLSFAQQRLWVLDHLEPASRSYDVLAVLRLHGPLDVSALQDSLAAVVARHDVLRTRFTDREGVPGQVVAAAIDHGLAVEDLRGLAPHRRDAQSRDAVERLTAEAFDIAAGDLLRTRLLVLGEREHELLVRVHHIVFDDWSMRVLMRDLAELYDARTHGRPPSLTPLSIQYADYAAWQRQWLQGPALQRLLDFWGAALDGAPTQLELGTDRPRNAGPPAGAQMRLELDGGLADDLRAYARRSGVTLFSTLLAGFELVLQARSGASDLVIGTAVAGRDRLETEGLIGNFVNLLALRLDLRGDPGFAEIVARTSDVVLAALTHQDLPFDRVVGARARAPTSRRQPAGLGRVRSRAATLSGDRARRAHPDGRRAVRRRRPLRPHRVDAGRPRPPGRVLDLRRVAVSSRHGPADARRAGRGSRAGHGGSAAPPRRARGTGPRRAGRVPAPRPAAAPGPPRPRHDRPGGMSDARPTFASRRPPAAKPKPLQLAPETLVRFGDPAAGTALPLLAAATVPGVDLAAWSAGKRELVDDLLATHGGVLFRGFRAPGAEQFEQFVAAVAQTGSLIAYGERSSPRSQVAGRVYTSTDHPPDQRIILHNEQSYTLNWPMRIAFACVLPAREGGRTPLADARKVLARLDPQLIDRFARGGVMYVRNYGHGLGLPWREAFQTPDRAAVEAQCRAREIEFEWLGDDGLRTRQVRAAVRAHPATSEPVWFNHGLFFHASSVDPSLYESLRATLDDVEMPFNVFHGDGSPIEPAALDAIRAAYEAETVSFEWQAGDVLLLDNMLVCHGREPFSGPRQVLTAMADPVSVLPASDLPAATAGES